MSRLYEEPVKNTCPDIDRLLKDLDQAERDFRSFNSEDEKACDAVGDLLDVLWNVYGQLEDIRHSNSALREWGFDLVSHSEELEKEVQMLEELNEVLESKVEELED